MTDEFNIDNFDSSAFDPTLYNEGGGGAGFPRISWQGRQGAGYFTLDADSAPVMPGPFWKKGMHRYGTDPGKPATEVYMTQRLRGILLGDRKRAGVKDPATGAVIQTYDLYTPRRNMENGRYFQEYQAMLHIPGLENPVVFGMTGQYRTQSWSNPEQGKKGHDPKFHEGVESRLKGYARAASKHVGSAIPWQCSFWIDLTPILNESGDGVGFVQMGQSGTYVTPFTVDLSIDPAGEKAKPGHAPTAKRPRSRYVGNAFVAMAQTLRQDIALPWEAEWSNADQKGAVAERRLSNDPADSFGFAGGDDGMGIPFG